MLACKSQMHFVKMCNTGINIEFDGCETWELITSGKSELFWNFVRPWAHPSLKSGTLLVLYMYVYQYVYHFKAPHLTEIMVINLIML